MLSKLKTEDGIYYIDKSKISAIFEVGDRTGIISDGCHLMLTIHIENFKVWYQNRDYVQIIKP